MQCFDRQKTPVSSYQKYWQAAFQPAQKLKRKEALAGLKPKLQCLKDAFVVSCPGHSCFSNTETQLQVLSICKTDRKQLKKPLLELGLVGEKKLRTKENLTFSIFCSQPLQVLLLDFAYSAAKSFRLFSALPPPSWSPPFPGEQRQTQSSASNVILPHFYKKSPLCQIVSSLH